MTPFDGPIEDEIHTRAGRSSSSGAFYEDVVVGLGSSPKRLSPKYFYDTEGSLLFDSICDLPEYYVTRTELAILAAKGGEIARRIALGAHAVRVVEPGAGSGTKTRLLLRALGRERCAEYVPVDIAGEHLQKTAAELRSELSWLRVTPLVTDFSVELPVPDAAIASRTVVYFPGSTIGNFDPDDASRLLSRFREAALPHGLVLLGIDLKKDPALIHAAYNDERGITAAFNKNILRRMNAELGGDFDLDAFHHYAFYLPSESRVEMHLVSSRKQSVHVGESAFSFEEGESICTEKSYKYDLSSIERLGRVAGLSLEGSWLDDDRQFAVLLFGVAA